MAAELIIAAAGAVGLGHLLAAAQDDVPTLLAAARGDRRDRRARRLPRVRPARPPHQGPPGAAHRGLTRPSRDRSSRVIPRLSPFVHADEPHEVLRDLRGGLLAGHRAVHEELQRVPTRSTGRSRSRGSPGRRAPRAASGRRRVSSAPRPSTTHPTWSRPAIRHCSESIAQSAGSSIPSIFQMSASTPLSCSSAIADRIRPGRTSRSNRPTSLPTDLELMGLGRDEQLEQEPPVVRVQPVGELLQPRGLARRSPPRRPPGCTGPGPSRRSGRRARCAR